MNGFEQQLASALQRGFVDGDWARAKLEVRQALALNPSSPKALLALGICQFHARDFIEAIATLDRAAASSRRLVDDEPQPWEPIYLFRAISYAARRLPQASQADFAVLLELGASPVNWERFSSILRPDEMKLAQIAASRAGMSITI